MCCGDVSPSVLTPYYSEEVLFSLRELEVQNEDGVSILFYVQKIFPGEIYIMGNIGGLCFFNRHFKHFLFFWWYQIDHADEWNNFLERVSHDNEEEFKGSDELEEDKLEKLRLWASYRGQTLTRTGKLFVLVCGRAQMHVCMCFFIGCLCMWRECVL